MNTRLRGLKLRTLVRDHASQTSDLGEPVDIGVGAALLAGDEAWVLVEERQVRALGIGLAWMHRAGATALHIVTDGAPDEAPDRTHRVLARRAREFAVDVSVWNVRDRDLVPATPEEHRPEVEPSSSHLGFGAMILDSGADVVIEHGVVSGEVLGLEVCRVVDDAVTGRPRLEVGVGVHDREAFALLHGEKPQMESLKRIVEVVRGHRREGANPHPLNRLASERSLRSRVVLDPTSIGARELSPVSSAMPRTNVKDAVPCAALGESVEGEPLLAVFSTGIDLDVVPASADTRSWHGVPDVRLAIVVPERDASAVTHRLANMLVSPATVVALPGTPAG